jgi:4'-phosphopantetheinyl transferase EntD
MSVHPAAQAAQQANASLVGASARSLQAIVPAGAVGAEIQEDDALTDLSAGLYPEERRAIESASESRRREFAAGRACARSALAMIGVGTGAIPAGPDGAPEWPAGMVGSITHKASYRAATVARVGELAGVGIDAELDDALPPGVLASIASAGEADAVERLLAERPGLAWDRLLFSAKEAAVKAAYPLGLGRAELRSTEIRLDPTDASFTARPDFPVTPRTASSGSRIQGRWLVRGGLLIVAAGARRRK